MTETTTPPVTAATTTGAVTEAAGDHAAILARLDAMSAQLAAMAAQVAAMEAARQRWAELVETLVPVTRGAVDVATEQLADLSADVTLDDVTRLARTTVRAAPQLDALLGQLGSFAELGHEVTSLSGAGVARLIDVLQAAEDKGYFTLAREGAAIADTVVTTYSGDDVRALGANVVTIIDAVKELTQPQVMALLNRTALTIQEVEDTPGTPPTMRVLLRSMRDPQTRRGMARLLAMLHTVGAEEPSAAH